MNMQLPQTRPWQDLDFMTSVSADSDGSILNVARCAASRREAPTVVFLHGVLRSWKSFYTLLPALRDRCHIVAMDFRGHHRSGRVPNGYHVTDYTADVLRLSESLPDRCLLYGHSLGAMVALQACSLLPDRFPCVVLEDPPFETMGSRLAGTALGRYFAGVEGCLRDADAPRPEARTTGEYFPERISHFYRSFSGIVVGQRDDGTPIRVADQRDETALWFSAECLSTLDPEVIAPITSGTWMTGYDLSEILRTVSSRVIILQADTAAGGMLADADARSIASDLQARCHVRRFPGRGHSLHWQCADDVLEILNAVIHDVSAL